MYSTRGIVLAACEIDNSTACEMDYSKTSVERLASWTGAEMNARFMNRGVGALVRIHQIKKI